jgi:hypothetical protein
MFFEDRFELAPYGEKFKNSYVDLKLLDKNQALKYIEKIAYLTKSLDAATAEKAVEASKEIFDYTYNLVADCFIRGEIWDDELQAERPMRKTDIESFPSKVIKDLSQFIQGNVEKKS